MGGGMGSFGDPPESSEAEVHWDTAHKLRVWKLVEPDPEYQDIQEWEIEHPQSCPRAVTIHYPSCRMSVEFECQVQYEIDNAGLESLDPNPLELDDGEYLITAWSQYWPEGPHGASEYDGGMEVKAWLHKGIWRGGEHQLLFSAEQLANWVQIEERALQTTSRATQKLKKHGLDQNLLGPPVRPEP